MFVTFDRAAPVSRLRLLRPTTVSTVRCVRVGLLHTPCWSVCAVAAVSLLLPCRTLSHATCSLLPALAEHTVGAPT